MKTIKQKKKSFIQEVERLQKENDIKEEKNSFDNILKKATKVKKQKPSSR